MCWGGLQTLCVLCDAMGRNAGPFLAMGRLAGPFVRWGGLQILCLLCDALGRLAGTLVAGRTCGALCTIGDGALCALGWLADPLLAG